MAEQAELDALSAHLGRHAAEGGARRLGGLVGAEVHRAEHPPDHRAAVGRRHLDKHEQRRARRRRPVAALPVALPPEQQAAQALGLPGGRQRREVAHDLQERLRVRRVGQVGDRRVRLLELVGQGAQLRTAGVGVGVGTGRACVGGEERE